MTRPPALCPALWGVTSCCVGIAFHGAANTTAEWATAWFVWTGGVLHLVLKRAMAEVGDHRGDVLTDAWLVITPPDDWLHVMDCGQWWSKHRRRLP